MRPNRLIVAEAIRAMGIAGVLGAALLAFALMAALAGLLPAQRELADGAAELRAARELLRNPRGLTRAAGHADQLELFQTLFPKRSEAPALLERLYALAASENLAVNRAEYKVLAEEKVGLTRYQLVLPLSGDYARILAFLDAALTAMPTLALDELDFRRERIGDTQLSVRIRFTLYLAGPS